jgi:hypothetical protein
MFFANEVSDFKMFQTKLLWVGAVDIPVIWRLHLSPWAAIAVVCPLPPLNITYQRRPTAATMLLWQRRCASGWSLAVRGAWVFSRGLQEETSSIAQALSTLRLSGRCPFVTVRTAYA